MEKNNIYGLLIKAEARFCQDIVIGSKEKLLVLLYPDRKSAEEDCILKYYDYETRVAPIELFDDNGITKHRIIGEN